MQHVYCLLLQRPEEGTGPLEQELWMVVIHHVLLGTEPQVLNKSSLCSLALKPFLQPLSVILIELRYLNSHWLRFFKIWNEVDENVDYIVIK